MKKRLLLVYDWYHAADYDSGWHLPDFCRDDYLTHVACYLSPLRADARFRFVRTYLEYFRLAAYAIAKRRQFDVLVFWAWPIGVMVAFIARLLMLRLPRLLILNFISYRKTSLLGRIERTITRLALPRVDAMTVAASSLKGKYYTEYGYKGKLFYLPDPYDSTNRIGTEGEYIFAGGASLRDWPTLLEAARRLNEQKFVICAASSDNSFAASDVPANVTVHYDVGYDMFYGLLAGARFVVLPLADAEATSGLMVLLRAFDYAKAVIATRNACLVDYVVDGRNGLLVRHRDVDDLIAKIELLSSNPTLIRELGRQAKASLDELSWERYYRRFDDIVKDLISSAAHIRETSVGARIR